MKHSMKISVASLTVAGALALGGAGTAFAQGSANPTGSKEPAAAQGRGRQVRRGAIKLAVQTAASTIGMEPSALKAAVKGGQTIGQVADANGSSAQAVVDAIVAAFNARIDEAVSKGTIDAARAAKVKERVPAAAARIVNTLPKRLQGAQKNG